ncbi:MAG: carotenoid 1,2-hydratase [Magnetococcales bacterium]|nr:carotenoid 1,2-hydratase [Magnetococcales bacterium]
MGLGFFFLRQEPNVAPAPIVKFLGEATDPGFDRPLAPREFRFPEDHGPHARFKQEWWYMTGNLATKPQERRFGFELTLFRIALAPQATARTSAWGSSQVMMGHFALTDIQEQQFHHGERFSRIALDLAGAIADPFRVWLGDWSITATGGTPERPILHLKGGEKNIRLDLNLVARKPVVLQGQDGLSRKGDRPGNASYYYSLPRMETSGTITLGEERFEVSGWSWFDREWSTNPLDENQEGWDWFAVQLSDGWDLMLYRMRDKTGRSQSTSGGTLIDPEGKTTAIDNQQMDIVPHDHWQSPVTGIIYPSGWSLKIASLGIDLTLIPWSRDQELNQTLIRYWEGAVRVRGVHGTREVQGNGYVELAGYR